MMLRDLEGDGAEFLKSVAHPNMMAALERPDDMRAIINAILTLDALAGAIYADRDARGAVDSAVRDDDAFREELSRASQSFRVLRDAAASVKHGSLTRPRRNSLPRLVRSPRALRTVPNGMGLFRFGDRIGGEVIVIEYAERPGYVRASSVIADSYRMLKRVVEGAPASTDEHDCHGHEEEPPAR